MNENILGCFFQIGFDPNKSEQDFIDLANIFKLYISGERGISHRLKKLKHADYGKDLVLALFQFYVKPTPLEFEKLKSIENYRKSEKSIGIPIIVNEDNFFSKSESQRYDYLIETILQKIDLLEEVIKKKKLDTDIKLLKSDLENVLKTL